MNILWRVVQKRYPEGAPKAIGGVLFLRFFNPVIASPGIEITNKARRGLLLASKVLQNLANETLTTHKEKYMHRVVPWLEEHSNVWRNFVTKVSTP